MKISILGPRLTVWLVASYAGLPAAPPVWYLVPFPKDVQATRGVFPLSGTMVLEGGADRIEVVAGLIGEELRQTEKTGLRKQAAVPESNEVRLLARSGARLPECALPDDRSDEGYCLSVAPAGVFIRGRGPAGLLHGVHTLVQLLRANRLPEGLPCVTIRDWPSLRWRAFQNDLTRGPSAKLETLQRQVRLGALLKMNLFTYYMEYQYAFTKHPDIAPPDGSLQPAELRRLVETSLPLGVQILGAQQSFGHLGWILKHERFAPLREGKHVITPASEETYRFLDDLYSEICPLVPFPFFNVNCDETWELGMGPSRELVQKIGVGAVYAGHMRRIHDLLATKYHKRMMMWADIIAKHPESLKDIPKDTILLSWGYHIEPSFEHRLIPIKAAGYDFFVCPGIANWRRIFPDFYQAQVNIRTYVRDGARHGALGMINTEWKDDGEALNACNWHGYAWGAECAWNASKTEPVDFNRRLGAVLFGEKENHFGRAIAQLSLTHCLPVSFGSRVVHVMRFWDDDFPLKRDPASIRAESEQLLLIARPAIAELEACQRQARVNADLLEALIFGARRLERIALRGLDALEVVRLYRAASEGDPRNAGPQLEKAAALVRSNRDACAELGRQFVALWNRENRPYALDWTTARYQKLTSSQDSVARRLIEIRDLSRNGRPLPAPSEIGLIEDAPAVP